VCQFKSAIVVKDAKQNGGFRLLLSPWTDSHSDLIALHSLRDDGKLRFARIEYSPPDMSAAHRPETYKLKIDEGRTPEWFDGDMKEAVAKKMQAHIKTLIVTGEVALLMGGQFIIAPGAKIGAVKNALVASVLDASIDSVYGSAHIGSVSGSARIGSVSDSARIDSVYGSASIGYVSGSARIDSVYGSASIGYVSGSARIGSVSDSARIDSVYGSASIVKDARAKK